MEERVSSRRSPARKGTPHTLTRHERWLAWGAHWLLKSLAQGVRFRIDAPPEAFERLQEGPMIFCIWHNRLAVVMRAYRQYGRPRRAGTRLAALVSASRDGAKLAEILACFGVEAVRGSSSRRGAQGLREMVALVEQGYDVAITPDGPRGPRYSIQPGVISLAQLTGVPVLPVSAWIHPKICLRSWDRFQLPIPFGRCAIQVGSPLWVPAETTEEDRAHYTRALKASMDAITRD